MGLNDVTITANWKLDHYCNAGAKLTNDESLGYICVYSATEETVVYDDCGICYMNHCDESCRAQYGWSACGCCPNHLNVVVAYFGSIYY